MSSSPVAEGFEPEIVVLCCERAAQEVQLGTSEAAARGLSLHPTAVACGIKVEIAHLLELLERGADRVELVVCGEQDCQFVVGRNKARSRIERARALLSEIGVPAQRLGISSGDALTGQQLIEHSSELVAEVLALGPSPFKQEATQVEEGADS